MMKKILLILALLMTVCMNVSAETKYTDYVFQGYIEEKLEDDELNRYEATTFNKFYKPYEKDINYFNTLDVLSYDYVDPNDYILKTFIQEGIPNVECRENFAIWIDTEYKIDRIIIENSSQFTPNLRKISFYDGEIEVFPSIEIDAETDILTYTFDEEIDYSRIRTVINYDKGTKFTFNYATNRLDGKNPIPAEINITGVSDTTHIFAIEEEKFTQFLIDNMINFKEVLRHYEYDIPYYKHYNIGKEYYIDSVEEHIEGYTYDPEESYILYKKYTREKIEEPEKTEDPLPIEPSDKKPGESQPSDSDDKGIADKPKDEIKDQDPPKIDTSAKETVIKHIYAYEPVKKEEVTQIEEAKEPSEPLEVKCDCHCDIPKNCQTTSKDDERSKFLIKIGVTLIIIAIILMIIYDINVNRTAKND